MARNRIPKILVLSAVASLLFAVTGALAEECSANVRGTLTREDPDGDTTRLEFKVDVDTMASCADIEFDLVLEIQQDGKVETKRLARIVRLRNGSTSQKVNHQLRSGQTLVSWDVELSSCTRCG